MDTPLIATYTGMDRQTLVTDMKEHFEVSKWLIFRDMEECFLPYSVVCERPLACRSDMARVRVL